MVYCPVHNGIHGFHYIDSKYKANFVLSNIAFQTQRNMPYGQPF